MKSNINDKPLKVVNNLPNTYGRIINNYAQLDSDVHYNDGWRDVVVPPTSEYQRLGNLYYDELNDVVSYVVVNFTDAEIQEAELQKEQQPLLDENDKYIQRIEDGKQSYALFSAKLRLAKLNDEITEVEHIEIEETLTNIRNEVIAGQWINAKRKFEEVKPKITETYPYNLFYDNIIDYITKNY